MAVGPWWRYRRAAAGTAFGPGDETKEQGRPMPGDKSRLTSRAEPLIHARGTRLRQAGDASKPSRPALCQRFVGYPPAGGGTVGPPAPTFAPLSLRPTTVCLLLSTLLSEGKTRKNRVPLPLVSSRMMYARVGFAEGCCEGFWVDGTVRILS